MTDFNESLALQLLESDVEFPVDFEDAWRWLEYHDKSTAKRALLNCGFTENIDFEIRKTAELRPQGGFSNRELIFLTVDCFKQWCMMSGTEKGKEVRLYFIKCEKLLKEQIKKNQLLDQSQLALQLTSFIEEQRQTTKLLMERTTKLDAIEEVHTNNPGIKDVIDGELEHTYPDDISFTVFEYLEHKGVNLNHATTLSKRAAQFVRCGSFGQPTRNGKCQYVYTGNQINYLDCALRTILDI